MMTLLIVVLGLLFLSVLVVIHELGHFLVARAFGIRVDRFSVGFGKALFQWRRGDTTWSIAAVPLGGYVRMAGENPEDDERTGAPDEFLSKAWWQRLLVVVAGPLANLAFAAVAFSLIGIVGFHISVQSTRIESADATALGAGFLPGDQVVAVGAEPVDDWYSMHDALQSTMAAAERVSVTVTRDGVRQVLELETASLSAVITGLVPWASPTIGRALHGNPAYQAGLRGGDRVLTIDGKAIDSWNEMRDEIIARPAEELAMTILRGESELQVTVRTIAGEDRDGGEIGLIGITMDTPLRRQTMPLAASIRNGLASTVGAVGLAYTGIWSLISDFSTAKTNIAGPVTIIQMVGSTAPPAEVLNKLAFISIFLMVVNLLPIPILDGGHAMFCLVEGVRGSPLTMRSQLALQKVGLVIIGSLLILALWNDVGRITERRSSVQALQRQLTSDQP